MDKTLGDKGPAPIEHRFARVRFGHHRVSDGEAKMACHACVFGASVHADWCPFGKQAQKEPVPLGVSVGDQNKMRGT